jgi:hypothetical protein
MLLIGILGDVGAGKTSLLLKLADWWRSRGGEVEGFVAIAGERPAGSGGAARYDLMMLKSSIRYPYALRNQSSHPPYQFDGQTTSALIHWADGMAAGPSPSLVILDEFGPREAAGDGHVMLWPGIRRAKPGIVIVSVRKGLEQKIATHLGTKFEFLIDVGSGDAWESVMQACMEHSDWTRVGLYGGGAGGFEASLGAILHGGQIPLRGLFMSSMQSVIMTYAADGMGRRERVVWVSVIAASLKALSPAGNRVRPMMAITGQGLLYTLAIAALGWNILGVALGGFLIGAWSAIQGVALQYLFIGNELLLAYDSVIQWIVRKFDLHAVGFLQVVGGWILLCGLVSGALTVLAWRHRRRMPVRLRDLVFRKPAGVIVDLHPVSVPAAIRRGLKDIARPVFWLPVLFVVGVMAASGSSVDSVLWVILRAAVLGFVLFSVVRSFDFRRFIAWLQNRGHWGPALAFRGAMERVEGREGPPSQPERESSSHP